MVPWKLPAELASWVTRLDALLHRRLAGRLATVLIGMLFAQGRRTVASWLRAADVGQAFPAYYYFLGSLGRKVDLVASALLRLALQIIAPGDCLLLALDDSPTKRYGPKVQGAGIHHNPTPGPADQKFLYGHVWVTLSWVVRHACWGTIGLPLLAALYVRQVDLANIISCSRPKFQTKLEQAAVLVEWLAGWLR